MLRPLVVSALAAVASACGSESFSAAEAETVREAAARSTRVEMVTRADAGDEEFELRTTGVNHYASDRSEYVTAGPYKSRTITIGPTTYQLAEGGPPLPKGRRWIREDGSATTEQEFVESQERQELETKDGWTSYGSIYFYDTSREPTPTGYVDYLRDLGAELKDAGRGEVRGVATTRLVATVTAHRQARHDLESAGWKPSNIDRYLETFVDTTTDVEVWVDDAGVVRRIVETTHPADLPDEIPDTRSSREPSVTTTEFFDFGVDVEIEAPPEDEVMEWEEWARLEEQEPREDELEGIFPAGPLEQILPDG